MQHRHAAHRRLRGGKSPGLGDEQIRSAHIGRHLAGIAHYDGMGGRCSGQLFVQELVAAADDDQLHAVALRHGMNQAVDGLADPAAAHAAPGDEDVLPPRIQVQQAARFLAAHPGSEAAARGDAEGMQLLRRKPPAQIIPGQVSCGGDVRVAVGFLREGDAHIVGGYEDRRRNRKAAVLHVGHDLRGVQVGHDDHIRRMLRQVGLHHRYHAAVGKVHRRTARQLPIQLARRIDGSKQLRCLLHHGDIDLIDPPCQLFALHGIGIEHRRTMSAPLHFLQDGLRRRIMAATRTAGQNQRIHRICTPIGSLSSLLLSIFRTMVREIIRNPTATAILSVTKNIPICPQAYVTSVR